MSGNRLLVTPLKGHSIFISAHLSTDTVSALSPKGLGINKTVEATMRPSTHVNMRRVRPGIKKKKSERKKKRETETDRHGQRDKDRQTETEKEREKRKEKKERERDRQRQRETETERHRQTDRQRQKERVLSGFKLFLVLACLY